MVALNAEVKRRALVTATSLHRRGAVRATFVFGSHAEGRADDWSDIDVAVFMDDVESWDLWYRTRLMTEIQKEVGFDIEVHLFPASSLAAPVPGSFAEYVIHHGVRVGSSAPKSAE